MAEKAVHQTSRMKELAPEVPAILISGSVKAFDRAYHADALLPKGACSPVEMLERVRVMVARKARPKEGGRLASSVCSVPTGDDRFGGSGCLI